MARQTKTLGDYAMVLSRVRRALSSQVTAPNSFANERDFGKFKKTVQDGRRLLPSRYHQPYVDVLDDVIRQAEKANPTSGSKSQLRAIAQMETVFGTLAQPIVQLADSAQSDGLKAFQALVSNLYRRFMDDPKIRMAARKTLKWPEVDPLAFFARTQQDPFTLAATDELPIALIGKPASHAMFVPLWLIDGHEVGGHVIHDGIVGFENEVDGHVKTAIETAFQSGTIRATTPTIKLRTSSIIPGRWRTLTTQTFMTQLFAKWLPELLADAAGVLNMGPMYANGGMLVLAAHRVSGKLSNVAAVQISKGIDTHPADVVRALFSIVIAEHLDFDQAKTIGTALRKRLAVACGGSLPDKISFQDGSGGLYAEVDFADLAQILPVVANCVAKQPLKSLGDRSLTDLMTWGNKDEATTAKIAKILPRGHKFEEAVEARHVVSAAVLAVEQASGSANFVTVSQRIHDNSVLLLKSLYEEQCLLCAVPEYGPTRRKDIIKLADLARLVKKMRAR